MLHLRGVQRATVVGLFALGAPVAPAPARAQRPVLDSTQLLADISALAADSMEGRRVGTPGGARARAYLLRAFTRIGLTPAADSFAAPFHTQIRSGEGINGVNLVAMVRGTRHADRYVVVSAHYDHLGMRGKEIFHGADDNASGSAGVLALAQWFVKHLPENTLMFVLFDGEESGDVGSKAFVKNPPVPLERIVADVNLDMVSRNVRGELYVAGASPYPVLKPLLDTTAAASRVKLLLGHDTGNGESNWIHQSDQGSFADKNIPFAYFGVEDHADYHRSTDTVERIQPGFFFQSVQTVADFVSRLDRNIDRVAAVRAGAHPRT
jgi:Zn-dependent M28 family amino/carboxypeptidase